MGWVVLRQPLKDVPIFPTQQVVFSWVAEAEEEVVEAEEEVG